MRFLGIPSLRKTGGSIQSQPSLSLEALEERRMLVTDLDPIIDFVSLVDTSFRNPFSEGSITNVYSFTTTVSTIDILLSGQSSIFDNLKLELRDEQLELVASSDNDLNRDEDIRVTIPDGKFFVHVGNNNPSVLTLFKLSIAEDRAGGEFVVAGEDRPTLFDDGDGKEYGNALEDGNQFVHDFIGYLEGGHLAADLVDVHLFTLAADGRLNARIDSLIPRATLNGVQCQVLLLKDSNNDGVFSQGTPERIQSQLIDSEDDDCRECEPCVSGFIFQFAFCNSQIVILRQPRTGRPAVSDTSFGQRPPAARWSEKGPWLLGPTSVCKNACRLALPSSGRARYRTRTISASPSCQAIASCNVAARPSCKYGAESATPHNGGVRHSRDCSSAVPGEISFITTWETP